ncbi:MULTISPECIES: helix-turn-helix domain-containing protein [unclassified Streptomyces]|uniref:helix-turn-helix domain-containing protein n=1 Tax=unclassified Streptomyces TaxID=2593676 RepID=UPI00367C7746
MPKDAAVEEFAGLVRALKARDGRSYEALGRRLSVSASTLHRYCSGTTVPEEFAVVDRLALLCGADGEERRALEEAWRRAARTRLPGRPTPPRPAQPSGDPAAPRQQHPWAVTAPGAVADQRAVADQPETRPRPDSAVPRDRGGWARGVARAGGVVAGVVALVLGAVLLFSGQEPEAVEPPPFTWAASSHVWRGGCGHTYLVDRAPGRVAPPPPAQDAAAWAGAHGAVHGGETLVRLSLQGRTSAAVVVQAVHVRVVGRAAPLPWPAYRMDDGCGGGVSPRHFAVDLDAPRPLARPVAGLDATGAEPRTIPAVALPYTVGAADPEELLVTARTAGCDCRWYLELEWSSQGRSGTARIGERGGEPFRTSGAGGGSSYAYDSVGRRWIAGEAS